ncbi:hypothetical protein [Glaciimonas sp. PAMC28666]|uniref:hypothetical protein n=1 Tax=Glaciimonas sp. PAMC28666 TaxID=2807626 RepID=UPI0019626473|nr:hypothetical protein [Glaciimonas sp. PAMC28666]QRX82246.1 hypothetical protein JQN73_19470 [Glaciimonas sp. PAMC28666]
MDVTIMVKDRLTHGFYELQRGDIITVDESLANALLRRGLVDRAEKLEDKSNDKPETKAVAIKTKFKGK